MSRFHRPRFSSALVLTLLCINSSFASPVANPDRSPVSIVSASAPVHIIDTEDLPPQLDLVGNDEPPVVQNDGTTVTTTYNVSPNDHRRRNPLSIVAASEPVHIIPADQIPSGQNLSGDKSNTTNDGTTVTTDTTPQSRQQTKPARTQRVSLLNLNNQTLRDSGLNRGLNCRGSAVMCIGATQRNVMHTLRDYMYAIPDGYRYYAGQKIACIKHTVYPNPWITWGFYCSFMQGNIPAAGLDGAEVQLKLQQLIEHGCLGCGSVPISPDNDPDTSGILTTNYVAESECEGLCYYVPPGSHITPVTVPQGMTLVS